MEIERTGLIYQILNLVNGKCYVGQTIQPFSARQRAHLSLLRRKVHGNPHLQSNYDFYGEDSFRFILLQDGIPYSQLSEQESFWANFLNAEYNVAVAGYGPMTGRNQTKEAKAKIGAASKGNKNRLGMKTSEETKAKMRASSPRRKQSPEIRALISKLKTGNKYTLGRKQTEEAKAKLRITHLGNKHCLGFKHTPETKLNMSNAQSNRKAVRQIDPITNEVINVFPGIAWAARVTGVSRIVITRVVNKKASAITAGGFRWEFV